MLQIGGLLISRCPKWIVPDWCIWSLFRVFWLVDASNQRSSAQWIVPDWCSYFVMILNFCIDRPFRVSIYQDNCNFFSNFCLDCPFGFSVHRDTHFCLSRLFRFATYWAFYFFDKVFLDCIGFRASLPPSIVVKVIAHGPSQPGVRLPLESGWKGSTLFWAQSLSLEFPWGRTLLLEVCFNLFL